jgi:AraC family L-rhamnose operon transcriptional activator RhaR
MTDRLQWKSILPDQRPVQFADWDSRSAFYAHDHDFYELVFITSGRGNHISAQGTARIAAGSVLLLVPGVWHEYRDCADLAGYDCFFAKNVLYRELAWITDDPVLGRMLLRNINSPFYQRPVIGRLDDRRLALAQSMLRDVSRLPTDQVQDRRTYMLGILVALLGCFADAVRGQVDSDEQPQVRPAHRTLTQRALALMGDDLTREWSLDELATALATTPGGLTRAFRAVVGRSPMASYAHCRMEHAAMLLLRSNLPISDIGAQVGFFDANYFARRFRSEIGMSASEYRRRFAAPAA